MPRLRDSRHSWEQMLRTYLGRKRRRPDGGTPIALPVKPDRPQPLSGGAAAPLEFDD